MLRQDKVDHDPNDGRFPEPGEDSRYNVGLASQDIIVKAKNRLTRLTADKIVVMGSFLSLCICYLDRT